MPARGARTRGAVRIARLDLADAALARRLLEVSVQAYGAEAALIGQPDLPMMTETVVELRALDVTWDGVLDDSGQLVAACAWAFREDRDRSVLSIERLIVHPAWARRGLGRLLLRALPPGRRAVVSTGAANAPAIALYEAEGFRIAGSYEAVPGLVMVSMERVESCGIA